MELASTAAAPNQITHNASAIDRWLWRIGLCFLMLLPFGLVAGTASTDIALSGVALMFVGHVLCQRDGAWLRIPWVPLALLIWAYYIAISFQAIQPMVSLKGALGFGRFVLFGVACQYWLLCHRQVRRWMVIAIASTCAFAAFDTWIQFFWGVDLFGVQARPGATWSNPVWPGVHYTRLSAIADKLKIGGTIIMQAFPAVVFWLVQVHQRHRSWRYRVLCLLAAFMVLAIVPLTAERTSTLWMLLGVACCYLWIPQTRKGLWYLLLPCVLCWALAFAHTPTLANRMLGSIPKIVSNAGTNLVSSEHKHNNIYTALNRTALNLYKANPVWGVGLKQFDTACQQAPASINKMKVYRPDGGCNNSPQNMYLEFLVNTGTVGTVLFLTLMGMWAWQIYQARRHFSRSEHNRYGHEKDSHVMLVNQPIMIGVLIALFLRISPFVTTTSFYFSWGAVTFWWFGAWALAYCDSVSKKQD